MPQPKNTDISKAKQVLNDVQEYTNSTTIHGLKYLGENRRPFAERCFWILSFIVSFVFLGFFIDNLVNKWSERSVILVEDTTPTEIYKIPFPAVTVCPQFKIKSKYNTYERTPHIMRKRKSNVIVRNVSDVTRQFEVALQICEQHAAQLYRLQYDHVLDGTYLTKNHIAVLLNISGSLRDVVSDTLYQEDKYQISNQIIFVSSGHLKMFSNIITTEGHCFTFNLPQEIIRTENLQTDYVYYNISDKIKNWNYDHGYFDYPSFPRRTWAVGEFYGLSTSLWANHSDLYNKCEPTNIGYKIQIHSPAVYPNFFTNFIPVQHQTKYKIKVQPKITTTSPSLRSFTPQQRQCYFNDERRLQFFQFYNKANCKLECFANYTIAKYGCVHFSLPRSNTTPICGSYIDFGKAYADCESSQSLVSFSKTLLSASSLEKELSAVPNITCDCLPECNNIDYEYSLDMYNIPTETNPWRRDADTQAAIKVFFEESSIIGMTRKQMYSFADLVSNFGGLMGLFVGASILSVFEILYFFVIRRISKNCMTSNAQ